MKRKSGLILSLLASIVAIAMLSDVNAQTQEPLGAEPSFGYVVQLSDSGLDLTLMTSADVVVFSDYLQDDPSFYTASITGQTIIMRPDNLLFIKTGTSVTSMVYVRNNETDVLVINGVLRDYWESGKKYRSTTNSGAFFSDTRYWRWGTGR